jgi:DNA-binding PadR family transcriptional regulator
MDNTFKAPQGILRALVLALASRAPVTGIDIIKELERATNSLWVPSPGSVYFIIGELKNSGHLMTMPGTNEKRYIATSKGEEEIRRTRAAFSAGLVRNALILSTLAEMIHPEGAVKLDLVRRILEAPDDKVRTIVDKLNL